MKAIWNVWVEESAFLCVLVLLSLLSFMMRIVWMNVFILSNEIKCEWRAWAPKYNDVSHTALSLSFVLHNWCYEKICEPIAWHQTISENEMARSEKNEESNVYKSQIFFNINRKDVRTI